MKRIKKAVNKLLVCAMMLVLSGCSESMPVADNPDGEQKTDYILEVTYIPVGTKVPEVNKEAEGTDASDNGMDAEKAPQDKDDNRDIEENITITSLEDAAKAAEKYATYLGREKYEKVYATFSDELKAQINEKTLATIWGSHVILLGDFEQIADEEIEVEIQDGYYVANVKLEYEDEESGVLASLILTEDAKLAGIWFDYYVKAAGAGNVGGTEAMDPRERSIQLINGDIVLDGRLTLPVGVENPPVVIMVQGSGQSDMDEVTGLAGNSPFRDIALGLADRGIATVRYNKRYYQYPELADATVTIWDEVLDDVYAAIDAAGKYEELKESDIYILGHSLGGMLAPKIAYDNEEISGIISLAGTPRGLEEVIYDQNMVLIDEMDTVSNEEKEELRAAIKEIVESVHSITDDRLEEPLLGATGYYWRSLAQIDTRQILTELNIPMLILQGSDDFQIYEDKDFKEWKELLAGRDNVRFELYEGLNHMFMPAGEAGDITDYDVRANVDEAVIEDIAEWINGL